MSDPDKSRPDLNELLTNLLHKLVSLVVSSDITDKDRLDLNEAFTDWSER
jgi:hypothetical protein